MIRVIGKRVYARFKGDKILPEALRIIKESNLEVKNVKPRGVVVKGKVMDVIDVSAKMKEEGLVYE